MTKTAEAVAVVSMSTVVPSETPTITSSPTATNTPLPTQTPTVRTTSTRTPILSSTPKPTATRKPTITPSPTRGYSAAEIEYAQAVGEIASNLSDSFTGLAKLSDAAGKNPQLIGDFEWRADMALLIATIQVSSDRIRMLQPPSLFASVHNDFLEAARHLDSMIDLFADGIDHLDSKKLVQATQELQQASAAVRRANEKIKKITGK